MLQAEPFVSIAVFPTFLLSLLPINIINHNISAKMAQSGKKVTIFARKYLKQIM